MVNIDINIGDEILVGRFKNKRIKVKDIGVDQFGAPTVNGKGILKIRVPKLYMKNEDNMKVIKEGLVDTINKISGISYKSGYYAQKEIEEEFKVDLNPLINSGLIKILKNGLVVFTEKFYNYLDLQKQQNQQNHKLVYEIKRNKMKNSNAKLQKLERIVELMVRKKLHENIQEQIDNFSDAELIKNKILKLYDSGKSQSEIAKILNISFDLVVKITKYKGRHVGRTDVEDDRIGDDPQSKQYPGRTLKRETKDKGYEKVKGIKENIELTVTPKIYSIEQVRNSPNLMKNNTAGYLIPIFNEGEKYAFGFIKTPEFVIEDGMIMGDVKAVKRKNNKIYIKYGKTFY